MSGPLAGLLVADFSRVLAGPYATMLLADLGADVIKVESPGGDDTRGWLPPTTAGLAAAGVPCGPVNNVAGGVALAEALGLGPMVTVGDGADAVRAVRNPLRFSATPASYALPPPRLGQHTDEVRAWLSRGRGAGTISP